jgi:uncharacterized protein
MESRLLVSPAPGCQFPQPLPRNDMAQPTAQVPKVFLSANDLLAGSFDLALKVMASGFHPDFIVGVWRGGTPVGIAVQEVLEYCGYPADHIAIRTSSYTGIGQQAADVQVHGLGYLIERMNAENSLLLIDDVFDSGRSVEAIIRELSRLMRRNMPHDVRVGTVYYKPSKNRTQRVPDYFVQQTEDWLVFPHELDGLAADEILANKPGAAALLAARRPR